ncbi:MAG: arginine--tRNA ligase [Candidatus Moranbacteria bacterium]|nr:arginine--tRNA ligase [Candidatus Moranbacteria bacterium]
MKNEIQKLIESALNEAKKANDWSDFEMSEIIVDYPKSEQFGDYTTNVAMILAKKVGKNPMEIAEIINLQLTTYNLQQFEKIEVAAPGYINFYLSKKYLQEIVEKINVEKEKFGNSETGKNIKINNEFISANPTGPLTVGNGRGGFYGDSLSRVLRKASFDVTNEYYVNDAGEQVIKLGHSVLKDEKAVYGGEYIEELFNDLADKIDIEKKSLEDEFARSIGIDAAKIVLEKYIKPTVEKNMQITFDVWMSEKTLYDDGFVDRAIETLKNKKLTFESEGALWLSTTQFGDDKDRVLIKSNGQKTYFASDCGYILSKMERGFVKIIEGWGADHHGYIARFRAAAEALGFSGDLKFLIVQLVKVMKDGKEIRMSKRAGNVILIDDLIDEIGHDVTRFFFLMYSPDTHMNFDLGLAKERSSKNPVFYVQYAHARIAGILEKAQESGISNFQFPISKQNEILSLLINEKELSLVRELNKFPELVEEIAESYEVHKLPQYAMKLADKFHSFYDACKVIDEDNKELTIARLSLINAVRIVLAETLDLIGVDAPSKM